VDELRPSTEIISTWRKPVAVTACALALGVMPHDRFMPTEPTDGYGYISGYNTGGTTSAASYPSSPRGPHRHRHSGMDAPPGSSA
jgi:hypothetical protein